VNFYDIIKYLYNNSFKAAEEQRDSLENFIKTSRIFNG